MVKWILRGICMECWQCPLQTLLKLFFLLSLPVGFTFSPVHQFPLSMTFCSFHYQLGTSYSVSTRKVMRKHLHCPGLGTVPISGPINSSLGNRGNIKTWWHYKSYIEGKKQFLREEELWCYWKKKVNILGRQKNIWLEDGVVMARVGIISALHSHIFKITSLLWQGAGHKK